MLGSKTPGCRHAFDIGEQQDACGEWKQFVEFQQPECRQAELGNPFGIFPVTATPSAGKPKHVATRMDRTTTASPTGLPGKNRSPKQQQQ